jgi:hypothetical protein
MSPKHQPKAVALGIVIYTVFATLFPRTAAKMRRFQTRLPGVVLDWVGLFILGESQRRFDGRSAGPS